MRTIPIGLIGCGTVGGGFVELLNRNRALIRERHGVDLALRRIGVMHREKPRPGVDRALLTDDADEVIDSDCRIVVELVGGTGAARKYVVHSLAARKHVVTANKALLADAGNDLHDLAETHRVSIEFEASVCGAIPVVRVLRGALAGSRIERIEGIFNGTCNFILSRMEEENVSFEEALRDAQARGFAEADPSLDISGVDSAQKLTIVSRLAFNRSATVVQSVRGIEGVTPAEVRRAKKRGKALRLVARCARIAGTLHLRVAPELLDRSHPLAQVREEGNGVVITVEGAGEIVLFGRGAGALPTATSVLADVIEVAGRC